MLLSSCANHAQQDSTGIYLRSEFSWWEAQAKYEFKTFEDGKAKVVAKIQNDGKPYNIKIADKAWSVGRNCGVSEGTNKEIKLNETRLLTCTSKKNNDRLMPLTNAFTFFPKKKGSYTFTLDLVQGQIVSITITEN